MKRYTIIYDRVNQDIIIRIKNFLKEVARIDGVKVDENSLSVMFEEGNESLILTLAEKYKMVDFVK